MVEAVEKAPVVAASREIIFRHRESTISSMSAVNAGVQPSNLRRSDSSAEENNVPEEQLDGLNEEVLGYENASSESETEGQTGQPYNELLQLLHANADNGPARKKRKVDNKRARKDEAKEEVPNVVQDEELAGNDLQDQMPSDEEEAPEIGDGMDEDEDGNVLLLLQLPPLTDNS